MGCPFLTRALILFDRTHKRNCNERYARLFCRVSSNGTGEGRSNVRAREDSEQFLSPDMSGCYSRIVLAGDVTMGTDVLEFIYLVCFFLGLGFAVLSALLAGVFSGHAGPHVDAGGVH